MADINAGNIAQVIILARELGEATQLGAHDGVRDNHAQHIAEQEFRAFVSSLTEEEKLSIVAVMWIGRDSFTADEYDEAVQTARQEAVHTTEDYLIGTPMLAEYLETGLEELGIDPAEAEDDIL